MEIKLLPKSLRSQIRSEITINTAAQCIKQLVINSLDAQATSVAVRVNFAIFKLQVIDNGIGISKKNFKLIGTRYATNKYYNLQQFENNHKSFPSRGESLASIIKLSNVIKITSKTVNSTVTYRKIFNKGVFLSLTSHNDRSSVGTTVHIENFMYNKPVRVKNLTNDSILDEIKQELEILSLIHPGTSFSLRNDLTGEIIFHTYKTNFVYQRIMTIYGKEFTKKFRKIFHSQEKFIINGLIHLETTQNKFQLIYVNFRQIPENSKIHDTINLILSKSKISKKQKFFAYIINIKYSYSEIDIINYINFEIEFKNWTKIESFLQNGIQFFLKKENLIDSITESPKIGSPISDQIPSIHASQFGGVIRGVSVKRKHETPENINLQNLREKLKIINPEQSENNKEISQNIESPNNCSVPTKKRITKKTTPEKKNSNQTENNKEISKNIEPPIEEQNNFSVPIIKRITKKTTPKKNIPHQTENNKVILKNVEPPIEEPINFSASTKKRIKKNEEIFADLPTQDGKTELLNIFFKSLDIYSRNFHYENEIPENITQPLYIKSNNKPPVKFTLNEPLFQTKNHITEKINNKKSLFQKENNKKVTIFNEDDFLFKKPLVPVTKTNKISKKSHLHTKQNYNNWSNKMCLILNDKHKKERPSEFRKQNVINKYTIKHYNYTKKLKYFHFSDFLNPATEYMDDINLKIQNIDNKKKNISFKNNYDDKENEIVSNYKINPFIWPSDDFSNNDETIKKFRNETTKKYDFNPIFYKLYYDFEAEEKKHEIKNYKNNSKTFNDMFDRKMLSYDRHLHMSHKIKEEIKRINEENNITSTVTKNVLTPINDNKSTHYSQLSFLNSNDSLITKKKNNKTQKEETVTSNVSLNSSIIYDSKEEIKFSDKPDAFLFSSISQNEEIKSSYFEPSSISSIISIPKEEIKIPNNPKTILSSKFFQNEENQNSNVELSSIPSIISIPREEKQFLNKQNSFLFSLLSQNEESKISKVEHSSISSKILVPKEEKQFPNKQNSFSFSSISQNEKSENLYVQPSSISSKILVPKEEKKIPDNPKPVLLSNFEPSSTSLLTSILKEETKLQNKTNPILIPPENEERRNENNQQNNINISSIISLISTEKEEKTNEISNLQQNCHNYFVLNWIEETNRLYNSSSLYPKLYSSFLKDNKETKTSINCFPSMNLSTKINNSENKENDENEEDDRKEDTIKNKPENNEDKSLNNSSSSAFKLIEENYTSLEEENLDVKSTKSSVILNTNKMKNFEEKYLTLRKKIESQKLKQKEIINNSSTISIKPKTISSIEDNDEILNKNENTQHVSSKLNEENMEIEYEDQSKHHTIEEINKTISISSKIGEETININDKGNENKTISSIEDKKKLEETSFISTMNNNNVDEKKKAEVSFNFSNFFKSPENKIEENKENFCFQPLLKNEDKKELQKKIPDLSSDSLMLSYSTNELLNQINKEETEEELNLKQMPDWSKQMTTNGDYFYLNSRTGMTSFLTPKELKGCNMTKRYPFMPKGMSPILLNSDLPIKELTPISRNDLHQTIASSDNELRTIKWKNYLQNKDSEQFFADLYEDKKHYEIAIPNLKDHDLPKKLSKVFENYTISKDLLQNVNILNQWDKKFIVAQILTNSQKLLILFDQHAAHERICLEKLFKDYYEDGTIFKTVNCKNELKINLDKNQLKLLKNYQKHFENWGLFYQITDNETITVTKIPLCWQSKDDSNAINKDNLIIISLITALIEDERSWLKNSQRINIALPLVLQNSIKMEACRNAIKFGDFLTIEQSENLIKCLSQCDLPFQCAHGRPTLLPLLDLNVAQYYNKESKINFTNLKKRIK